MMGGVVNGFGVGLTGESNPFAVGGPGGIFVVEVAGSDLGEFFRGDIDEVEVRAAAVEIADGVLLELKAVDDEGWRGFRFWGGLVLFFLLGGLGGFRISGLGILEDEDKASAVRRPFEIGDTLGNVGEALRFAATAVQQPDLILGAVAGGEE